MKDINLSRNVQENYSLQHKHLFKKKAGNSKYYYQLVFDNNLDKVYFLRQYIKDGSVSSKPFVKSRSFTSR